MGRPWDGQIGSLGEVLGKLEGDVLGTSLGPIFSSWIGTCNLASVIVNFAKSAALDKMESSANLIQGKLYNLSMAFLKDLQK